MTKSKMWARSDDVLAFSVSVPPLPVRFLDNSAASVLKLIEMKKKKEKTKKKVTSYLENVKKVCWRDRGQSNKLGPNECGKVKECFAVLGSESTNGFRSEHGSLSTALFQADRKKSEDTEGFF